MPRTAKDPVTQKKSLEELKNKPLTRRQELFVKELVSNDGMITNREAAINAGYPASSAHARAYEMMNPNICPHVVSAIKAYRDELDAKYAVNYQRHLRDLQLIRDQALQNGAYSAAVQAEYRRGQAHGDIYVNKSEIRHGSIDSMSKEEVMKALEEMRKSYDANVIDITPKRSHDPKDSAKAGERVLQASERQLEEFDEEFDSDET